jgi:hypothetical protein
MKKSTNLLYRTFCLCFSSNRRNAEPEESKTADDGRPHITFDLPNESEYQIDAPRRVSFKNGVEIIGTSLDATNLGGSFVDDGDV